MYSVLCQSALLCRFHANASSSFRKNGFRHVVHVSPNRGLERDPTNRS